MTRAGRPSRSRIFDRLDTAVADLEAVGGLPAPDRADAIWRGIWFEETHNSTAIEGNTLVIKEVRALLEQGRAVGGKELKDYLEVQAYAQAARWVYRQATGDPRGAGGDLISLAEIRETHRLTVRIVWDRFPPPHLDLHEGPGSWRRHDIAAFPGGMKPPPWTDVPPRMTDWLERVNATNAGQADRHAMLELAELHASFERIHPFRDGNGRAGRLLTNLLLVRHGYPPAVIRHRDRRRYLDALDRADRSDAGPLAELLARAITEGINRFLIPGLAGPDKLVPLGALIGEGLSRNALSLAARRGRLKAVQTPDGMWYSSVSNVRRYMGARHKRTAIDHR